MSEVFIYGAGGHGKVVFHALRTIGGHIAGFVDDKVRGNHCDRPVYSSDEIQDVATRTFHVAIGNNDIRRRVQSSLRGQGGRALTVIHPAGVVYPGVCVGDGNLILPHAVVGPDSVLGDGCIVNHNAVIDHDCSIGAFCHVAPGAILGGEVRVGETCLIGAGAVVLPGVVIGNNVIVGAGAVVTRDVFDGVMLAGNPARPLARP